MVSPASTTTYTLTATGLGGTATRTVTVTVQPKPSDNAFQQDSGADGLVVLEAEHFASHTPQGGHSWLLVPLSGASGEEAMEATPNNGTNRDTGYATASPRLDFPVHFVRTGTHYVWVRGLGRNTSDDSVHVGLDDQALASSDRIDGFPATLTWSKRTRDGVVATIEVPTAGLHTVNVWMREDGFVFDKLLLTTNAALTPSGTGPSESLRGDTKGMTALLEKSFQQDSGADGLVVLEAAHFTSHTPQGGHSWYLVSLSGAVGVGAMEATPNNGTNRDTGYATTSPCLDFPVHFMRTGTHYVWVRGLGRTGSDDSVHVGLDGQALASSDRIEGFSTTWTWSKRTRDGVVATIHVPTVGVHTVNVWMREDGFVFDKLLLTTNAALTPSGTGPAESPIVAKIVLEAEHGDLYAPMELSSNAEASGGQFVWVTESHDDVWDPSHVGGLVHYTFTIPQDDTYVLWGRVRPSATGTGSFFITIDEESLLSTENHVWELPPQAPASSAKGTASVWVWDQIASDTAPVFFLNAGVHTLVVKQRESGSQLDKILITNDLEYKP
jgi:hypothetical protein